MGSAVEPTFSPVPTATGGIARLVCARCRAAGLPLQPLLDEVGLSLEQIEDQSCRIEVRAQVRLLQIAADSLQDGILGFHLSQDFDLREVGLIYYVISSSGNFNDAMSNSERYTRIVNEGIELKFDAGRKVITLNCVDIERQSDRH